MDFFFFLDLQSKIFESIIEVDSKMRTFITIIHLQLKLFF